MMMDPIPQPSPIDQAWEEYVTLIRAMNDDPALRLDRKHVESALRAYARFRDLFLEAMD